MSRNNKNGSFHIKISWHKCVVKALVQKKRPFKQSKFLLDVHPRKIGNNLLVISILYSSYMWDIPWYTPLRFMIDWLYVPIRKCTPFRGIWNIPNQKAFSGINMRLHSPTSPVSTFPRDEAIDSWLVVDLPLWKIWQSNISGKKIKKRSKAPTSNGSIDYNG